MNVFDVFSAHVLEAVSDLIKAGDLPGDLPLHALTVQPPRDASHGDLASNAAMVLAKPAGQPPRAIAERLVEKLRALDDVEAAEVAGPGFINLRISAQFWRDLIPTILRAGVDFGASEAGAGKPVNVEYVSANPTGPLHVGHVRGAVFGDALANLLAKVGHEVVREYYINDAGGQIDTLARSVHLRYREALGDDIGDIPEGLYPGAYLVPVGAALAAEFGDQYQQTDEGEWLEVFRRRSVDAMMDLIRDDLAALGIHHAVFFSEHDLHTSGRIGEVVDRLRASGHLYEGVLEPPKGKLPDDWEAREQTLFRATDFGDDVDRALQKSDGSYTYFAADIAYHLEKATRTPGGALDMINVWGADHGGYVKRVQAALKALLPDATLDVKLAQLVRLFKSGEPYKMSKRSGNFITARDLVDEVGRDVTRFIMLTRKNDAPLDFDFDKVTDQSKENPVFYVQYAHARAMSVFRKAAEAFGEIDVSPEALAEVDLALLASEDDLVLIKRLAEWPRLLLQAAEAHEPHRVAFFLYDLASDFHTLWNKGNDKAALRFVQPDKAATLPRLALVRATALVIASGLAVLGVEPVQEM